MGNNEENNRKPEENQDHIKNQTDAQEMEDNTDTGYQQYTDPNSGYQYQNGGYQYQNNGYQYQNNGYQYQNNEYQYQNNGYQYQNGGYYQNMNGGDQNGMDTHPLSMGEWMLTILVMLIPCVNIIMYLIWAFSKTGNVNRRNYCRAYLIFYAIVLVLAIIFSVIFGVAAVSTYTYY